MSDHDGPLVVFLCVHNAGRSQMARAFFDHLADGRARSRSGGSDPADSVNPVAVAAMAEVGIDLSGVAPAPWDPEDLRAAAVVVTMGCGESCPVVPGPRYEDWPLPDPAGQDLAVVRTVRDALEQRVRDLLASLGIPPA